MKNNYFKNIKQSLNKLRSEESLKLTDVEQRDLRSSLFNTLGIQETPVGTTTSGRIPSPFSRWQIMFISHRLKVTVAAVLVVLFASSGVAYAAEKALPGDFLYPIKTNINENIQRAVVARTPEAKADLEVKFIDKRLKEADAIVKKYPEDLSRRDEMRKRLTLQAERTEQAIHNRDLSERIKHQFGTQIENETKHESKLESKIETKLEKDNRESDTHTNIQPVIRSDKNRGQQKKSEIQSEVKADAAITPDTQNKGQKDSDTLDQTEERFEHDNRDKEKNEHKVNRILDKHNKTIKELYK